MKRQVTQKEQAEIFHLGLPGIGFFPENKRIYPNGPIGAHVIGFVDKDNIGIAGMEKYLDEQSLTDPLGKRGPDLFQWFFLLFHGQERGWIGW